MRKLIALVLFAATEATSAQTFLIADPYPSTGVQPDQFMVTVDTGVSVPSPAVTNADGSKQLKFDLGSLNLGAGSHTISVKAVKLPLGLDLGGESTVTSVTVKKTVPAPPSGVGVRTQ